MHPMRIALGSDMQDALPATMRSWLEQHGHVVVLFGALAGSDHSWTSVGRAVGEAVAADDVDFGIVCCWTGTGVTIAANKVRGVRAALCADAATAAGAREWNDANVLCLSLRLTTATVAREILQAWMNASPTSEPADAAMIDEMRAR